MPVKTIEKPQVIQPKAEKFGRSNRIEILDFLRGAAMIFVMLYHLLYDLVYYQDMDIGFWGTDWFEWVHKFFLWILFAVSGICTSFSRDTVKRGAVIYLMGSGLTIVSNIFSAGSVFVFGVLSFFGMMMIISGLIKPVTDKIDWRILLAASLVLYVIFFDFAAKDGVLNFIFTQIKLPLPEDRLYLYPLGITHAGFRSMDYFPLIPNGFVYLAGAALAKPVKNRQLPKIFYSKTKTRALNFIGRHSLIFYIVHQPVFLLLTNIF
ncbi:MAG: DUF1624 domain-containing protein [Oscillospiraceae bacterium]|nr:DUF1624 domain-containing protein [Oscillospiraceae bacterium]